MRDVEPEMNKTVGAALQQWRLKQQVFHFVKACAALSGKSLEGEKKKKKKRTAQFVPYGVLYHLLLLLLFLFRDKEHKREKWWRSESE